MAEDKEKKIGLIVVIVLLLFGIIIVGIFMIMYTNKLNNYQSNEPYCPPLVCADGSTPFKNMAWYQAEHADEDEE